MPRTPAPTNPRATLSIRASQRVWLDIPDDYEFMQPELVVLLEKRVGPLLR